MPNSNHRMKKVFLAFLILILLMAVAVIAVPVVFKDKLVSVVNQEASKNLNAEVKVNDFSASIIKDFPNISLSLLDFNITGVDTFKNVSLVNGEELTLSINLFGLLQGNNVSIEGITLSNANINILVLEDGTANYDIAKSDDAEVEEAPSESGEELKINLKSWQISGSNFWYVDRSMAFETQLKGIENTGSGDFTLSQFLLKTNTSSEAFSLSYEGISYLSESKMDLAAEFDIDLDKMFFGFRQNELKVNDLILNFAGSIAMPENGDIVMDLDASTTQSQLKNLLSLIPAVFTEEYDNIKVDGGFDFSAQVKGIFNDNTYPAFNLGLDVRDGVVQYPDLPSKVDRIALKAKVSSDGGADLDNMVVDLANMHAEIANNPIDLALHLEHPISDPLIDAKVYGKIDFASLKKALPLDGYDLKGKLNANLTMKGKMSTLEMEDYENFNAAGSASLSRMVLAGAEMEEPVSIDTAHMEFNPKFIKLSTLEAKLGANKVSANGALSNYMAYVFKDKELVGNLNLSSDLLDLNALMTEDESTTTETPIPGEASSAYVEVPKNINFVLQSDIKKILYEDYVLENFKGELKIENQEISFNNVNMQSFGGDIALNGFYQTREELPKVGLNFKVENLDVNKVASTVNTVEKLAPIAKSATGKFDASFKVDGALDKDLNPVWNAYRGDGLVKTKSIYIENFEAINRLAEKLNVKRLAKQTIADTKMTFEIKEGRVFIKPLVTKLGDIPARIAGSTGFDQSIDYTFNLAMPKSYLGATANNAISGLTEKLGASSSENIDIDVFFTNTVSDPKLRVNLAGGVKDLKNQITDKLKWEFNNKKDSLENALKQRAAEEKQKLQDEADAAKKKLEEEKRKQEEEIKRKAEEERKRLEEEAKKKARNLLGKP